MTVRRRGYTLAIFALLMFGMMGLAALVIDLGFARLTQRQMQTAVDTAALEGLRYRDELPPGAATANLEEARRQAASDFVAWMFDDDLNPASGDAHNFGAGPMVELNDGVGEADLNASQLLTLPPTPVYKPRRNNGEPGLELNLENAAYGDMFAAPDSFTVRMRRTNNVTGLDEVRDVSSHGPSIPLLFGRAALLPPSYSGEYSPRRDGISVRAIAIAQAVPAISVGMPENGTPAVRLGVSQLTLHLDYWNTLTTGIADNQAISDTGEVGMTPVGRLIDIEDIAGGVVVLGQTLPASLPSDLQDGEFYVPIYYPVSNGADPPELIDRVVGFGSAMIDFEDASVTIMRHAGRVANENASATAAKAIPISGAELNAVLQHREDVTEPLLAPALIRQDTPDA